MFRRRFVLPIAGLLKLMMASPSSGAPVTFSPCSDSATPYILESLNITPYPPRAGETVEIVAVGKSSIAVVDGSTIHTSFKQGPLTTPEKTYNLCSISSVTCPLAAGSLITTVMQHEIGRFAGDGIASGRVWVLDPKGKELACVNVAVETRNH
ncbi:hypothetical protein VYU27_004002 [Nannochloropsis oceanica]